MRPIVTAVSMVPVVGLVIVGPVVVETHTYIYICIYVCMYVCMYVCISHRYFGIPLSKEAV